MGDRIQIIVKIEYYNVTREVYKHKNKKHKFMGMFANFLKIVLCSQNKENKKNEENMFGAHLFTVFENCFMFSKTRKRKKYIWVSIFFFLKNIKNTKKH